MKIRLIACLCILMALVSFAENPNPSYEVSVTTVTVWVKAVDKTGLPATGLKQDDFAVYEDKQRVPVTCFEEIGAAEQTVTPVEAKAEKPVQSSAPKFVIYLDLYNTAPREYAAIKPSLQRFIDSLAEKKREVMLAALTATGHLGIIVPFTTNLTRMRILLDQAKPNATRTQERKFREDQLSKVIEGAPDLIDKIQGGYDYARSISNQEKQATRFTLLAMQSFATYLSHVNLGDHAVLIYVSGGFSADPGRHYFDIVDDVGKAASSNEELIALAQERQTNFDFQSELRKSIGKLNRYDVTLYTLDAAGQSDAKDYQDSLLQIAQETGGLAFSNSQDFNKGLNKMLVDLDHQYILCYQSPPHSKRGEYHSIKVDSNKPGVKLRYRQGYVD